MIHPDTELRFISPHVGYGVVATKFIPKGSITWVMDKLDRVFKAKDLAKLGPSYHSVITKYCFRDNRGYHVLCWDLGRYINHSFTPNCLTTAYDFEVAVRDIQPGEQLTNHYGYLNLEPMSLLTDDGQESILVTPEDTLRNQEIWDKQIAEVMPFISTLDQPLRSYLPAKTLRKLEKISKGVCPLDSIANCYFSRPEISTS